MNEPKVGEQDATGADAAERLRVFVRYHMQGGCRILSLGDACPCPLCAVDSLASDLAASRAEVEQQAQKIAALHITLKDYMERLIVAESDTDDLRAEVERLSAELEIRNKRLTHEQQTEIAKQCTPEGSLRLWQEWYWELGDRYDRLDDENERLREALAELVALHDENVDFTDDAALESFEGRMEGAVEAARARAALSAVRQQEPTGDSSGDTGN